MKTFAVLFFTVMTMTFACTAPACADIASVKYVHKYLMKKWNISIPYSALDTNVVSMKYLMRVVDAANAEVNGIPTEYANDALYATSNVVSVNAVHDAIDRLVKATCPKDMDNAFCFVPATSDRTYTFKISAAGNYKIDWGDKTIETIEKQDTDPKTYSHTYENEAFRHKIVLTGKATAYNASYFNAAISFYDGTEDDAMTGAYVNNYRLSSFGGCLGCVFPTLTTGTVLQPRFYYTFCANKTLTGEIPENLFNGIYGEPVSSMFSDTFRGCSGLSGRIPENLFSGLTAAASSLFVSTFNSCRGLSGPIPEKLFAGIKGAPARKMFGGMFYNCSGLTGPIPAGLFSGLSGEAQPLMFRYMFYGCNGLTGSIPDDLFSGISVTDEYPEEMFIGTFYNNTKLSGPSAKIGGRYLYEIWPDVAGQMTYRGDTGLSDWSKIPDGWK